MAEYLIQEETLVSIADEIRVLNGTEDTMSPAEMVKDLTDVNTEVESQADLIASILTVLETKAAYNTIYIGSSEPTLDVGVDGDIYIIRSEAT